MDDITLRTRLRDAELEVAQLRKEIANLRPTLRACMRTMDVTAAELMAAQIVLEYIAEEAPKQGGLWVAEQVNEYFTQMRETHHS